MQILTKSKGILAAVAIFIVAMFLYNLFFKSDKVPLVSQLSSSVIGDDLLKIREDLQKVSFDQTLFSSPGYLSLSDFNVDIPQQSIGRPNPFNIIGRE